MLSYCLFAADTLGYDVFRYRFRRAVGQRALWAILRIKIPESHIRHP